MCTEKWTPSRKNLHSLYTGLYEAKRTRYPTNILTQFAPVTVIWYKTNGQELEWRIASKCTDIAEGAESSDWK